MHCLYLANHQSELKASHSDISSTVNVTIKWTNGKNEPLNQILHEISHLKCFKTSDEQNIQVLIKESIH